jgi:hypothetical protein
MGSQAENSLWYKGKSDVFREYKKNATGVLSAVAARNHSGVPGFAVEAFIEIETAGKFQLTELNQKILAEAIDREMKTLGLEHDYDFKAATMAWELEKQTLFSDLQREFADKELVRALDAETIESLMVDQELREIAVLLAKVAIEIEIEDLKRQKEETELTPLPWQEQLAIAQLATARRKMDVIPYIMAALAAQANAVDQEETVILPARRTKADYDTQTATKTLELVPLIIEKAAATVSLTNRQSELIPKMVEKAAASLALANAMTAQLQNRISLAMVKIEMAQERVRRVQDELLTLDAEIGLETAKISVEEQRAELELLRASARLEIATALNDLLLDLIAASEASNTAELDSVRTQTQNEIALKRSRVNNIEIPKDAKDERVTQSSGSALVSMANADKSNQINMARTASSAEITEKLIHLLA